MRAFIEHIEWFEVFDLLEQLGPPKLNDKEINDRFMACGLAYEMIEGIIRLHDPEGDALGVSALEHEAEPLLDGRFSAVREQYARGLAALHARPADLQKAISESVGSLEAVVRIITGKKDFGPAIDAALAKKSWMGGMKATLKALYGYASDVPGARHGRHADSDLDFGEAKFVVRTAGCAIAYLIEATNE